MTNEIIQTSHRSRLQFERIAGYTIAALVCVYGACGLWSKDMAERVVELTPALLQLTGVLGGVMGASWFRGWGDNRLTQADQSSSSTQGDK